MKATSLRHCKNGNYQTDYSGSYGGIVSQFNYDCSCNNGATWAVLCEEESGVEIGRWNGEEFLPNPNFKLTKIVPKTLTKTEVLNILKLVDNTIVDVDVDFLGLQVTKEINIY